MVERPIKKSELAAREAQEGGGDREGRSNDRRDRDRKGRKGGKGKGRGDREERPPAVAPALMRGPKPKPKAEAPEPEPEVTIDPAGTEAVEETSETVADTTEAADAPEATDPSA